MLPLWPNHGCGYLAEMSLTSARKSRTCGTTVRRNQLASVLMMLFGCHTVTRKDTRLTLTRFNVRVGASCRRITALAPPRLAPVGSSIQGGGMELA